MTRTVSIITGPSTHLDHLGVLSAFLDIPLIVTEERQLKIAKELYPNLNVSYLPSSTLTLEYIATHFDVIFETGKFWYMEMSPFIELLFHKKVRFIFCPHGNSDKQDLDNHPEQDISLVYGDHLLDLLKKTGALTKIGSTFRTGNYRHAYYLEHKNFYDKIVQEKFFSRFFNSFPTLLYAPTWEKKELLPQFFEGTKTLISQLCLKFNLLIKLHPFLVEDCPQLVEQLVSHYSNHHSVQFLLEFPPIYPLLNRCDLYLGDASSVGYDFLAFDRPLYFLNQEKKIPSLISQCGIEIQQNEVRSIQTIIENSLESSKEKFKQQRRSLYTYAFGKKKDPSELKQEIIGSFLKQSDLRIGGRKF